MEKASRLRHKLAEPGRISLRSTVYFCTRHSCRLLMPRVAFELQSSFGKRSSTFSAPTPAGFRDKSRATPQQTARRLILQFNLFEAFSFQVTQLRDGRRQPFDEVGLALSPGLS